MRHATGLDGYNTVTMNHACAPARAYRGVAFGLVPIHEYERIAKERFHLPEAGTFQDRAEGTAPYEVRLWPIDLPVSCRTCLLPYLSVAVPVCCRTCLLPDLPLAKACRCA